MEIEFKGNIILKGKIVCDTGLYIGESNDSLEIGGIDRMVMRDKKTDLPYIPGSSLKGKLRSLFKKSKVTDSIYDVLYRYYTNLANESVNNKQWDHYKTSIGHIINISVDNISDLKLLKLHIKYFILEANNWICDDYSDYYNPSFNLEFNKSRNDLIASLKLELNELQEIFDEAWSEVKIPSYTVTKADTFKKLILAFNGEDLNEIH